ncbi:hypothetical protein BDC45DRAFT_561595 [Circinella umbellata]|nr:hypothetical protein BDC45DRAFT_561595 [Circinella umbellata]
MEVLTTTINEKLNLDEIASENMKTSTCSQMTVSTHTGNACNMTKYCLLKALFQDLLHNPYLSSTCQHDMQLLRNPVMYVGGLRRTNNNVYGCVLGNALNWLSKTYSTTHTCHPPASTTCSFCAILLYRVLGNALNWLSKTYCTTHTCHPPASTTCSFCSILLCIWEVYAARSRNFKMRS